MCPSPDKPSADLNQVIADLRRELAEVRAERDEVRLQQKTTAEILRLINTSVADSQAVFDKILDSCKHLFGGDELDVLLVDEEGQLQVAAYMGNAREAVLSTFPAPVDITPAGRAIRERRVAHYPDVSNNPDTPRVLRRMGEIIGYHSIAFAPMLWEGRGIGAVGVARSRGAFSERELELLQSFADQAVIAIGNARLFNETKEALARQTATSEILSVINASPGDLTAVFEAMLDRAMRLCGAVSGHFRTYDGQGFQLVAVRGDSDHVEQVRLRGPLVPGPQHPVSRYLRGENVIHMPDTTQSEEYWTDQRFRSMVDSGGARAMLGAALRRDGALLGFLNVYRPHASAFSSHQIALLQNFAAQAVIAMENARLLSELNQRTDDLSESLQQQTATADVLKAISRSAFDLTTVLQTLVESAAHLCNAQKATITRQRGNVFYRAEYFGFSPEFMAHISGEPVLPDRSSVSGRALLEGRVVHIPDVRADPEYGLIEAQQIDTYRTALGVPMLREGVPIGVLVLTRPDVHPFSSKEIDLVSTFADQAVIAIENARLFTELRESLDQQTATAELLQVINSSPGELGLVFEAMLEKAMRLCGATVGDLRVYDGEDFRLGATRGVPDSYVDYFRTHSVSYGPGTGPARILAGEQVVHIPDLIDTEAFRRRDPDRVALVELANARASLIVPLIKDEKVAGFIMLLRQETGAFSDKQIALLQNFAAQAVIAMENARLLGELREALEQQTATAEVLQVINSSPGDLGPIFDVMLEKALRLCEATCGTLQSFDGERMHQVAVRGHAAFDDWMRAHPSLLPEPGTTMARLVAGEDVAQVVGLNDTGAYRSGIPIRQALVEIGGFQSLLGIALRKDRALIGTIHVYRQEARPFSQKQIALLQDFAAQAVIAMENARLLAEQREALERQTATAEVLRIINASPGMLEPVFDVILAKAHDLCGAAQGSLQLFEEGQFRAVATRGMDDAFDAFLRRGYRPSVATTLSREQSTQFADVTELARQNPDDPIWRATTELGQVRTLLAVPLVKDGNFLGRIIAVRREVRPFTDKQIALLESFAAQAVIAMENARLLSELRDRTDALARRNSEFGERIEQQAATIDVLKVMSSSPDNPQPIFDLIAQRSRDLCNGLGTSVFEFDGNLVYHRAITEGEAPAEELAAYDALFPMAPDRGSLTCRAILDRQIVHVRDLQSEDILPAVRNLGYRSQLTIPFLRDDFAIGAITLSRREAGGFTDSQVALLQTFAEQAVIAITSAENRRALQQRTEALARSVAELQALEEVLRAVNSSLDVETVLSTIISRAVELSGADEGTIYEFDDGAKVFVPKSAVGMSAERVEALRARRVRLGETHLGRAAVTRAPVHVEDIQRDPTLAAVDATNLLEGIHAVLAVPLLRNDKVVGGLVIRRRQIGGFAPTIQTLLQTFAGQAVLAIENARLFEEAQRARAEAETALADLRTAQDRLVQTEKLASLGQLTAGIAHEIKNPLNFVNNFAALSIDLTGELRDILAQVELAVEIRDEVEEMTGMLTGNLDKVVQHGKRADSIIKNMLLHSREGSGERRTAEINAIVEESLNLAYHGARGERPGFNVTIERALDPEAGRIDLYAQELTRVLLNIVSNGFYAVTKRKAEVATGYVPTLRAETRDLGDRVEIRIRDNGTGIPQQVRDKIFNPFFTTKPAGEGTGLGLSLSHDIIVKQHGGTIEVDTAPGEFTEFRIVLPRTASDAVKGERRE